LLGGKVKNINKPNNYFTVKIIIIARVTKTISKYSENKALGKHRNQSTGKEKKEDNGINLDVHLQVADKEKVACTHHVML
jgi:hypothetical protein